MGTLSSAFRTESHRIHEDHRALENLLDQFDASLNRLLGCSQVVSDSPTAAALIRLGRQLAVRFPVHCRHEEESLLAPVSKVSPQLEQFCAEMKREHAELVWKVGMLLSAIEGFEKHPNPSADVTHLRESGVEFSGSLREHLIREENELSGFL